MVIYFYQSIYNQIFTNFIIYNITLTIKIVPFYTTFYTINTTMITYNKCQQETNTQHHQLNQQ